MSGSGEYKLRRMEKGRRIQIELRGEGRGRRTQGQLHAILQKMDGFGRELGEGQRAKELEARELTNAFTICRLDERIEKEETLSKKSQRIESEILAKLRTCMYIAKTLEIYKNKVLLY